MEDNDSHGTKRRTFVQGTALSAAAAAFPGGAFAQSEKGDDTVGVALIGCGGRGTGAASQALRADDQAKLVAMADVDGEQLQRSHDILEKGGRISRSPEGTKHGTQMNVPPERRFLGLDAFQQVMELDDVDVVILTTPPGFRPQHFEAAVRAGKHVFMEKPVAVDGPGVRTVLEGAKLARSKGLKVGVGLNRRHSPLHEEAVGRLHDGVIGEIPLIRMYNCRSGVGKHYTRKSTDTELRYQVGNWYYFDWLSGDFPVEQSVHDYDVVRWIKGDANPAKCQGQGGRLQRTGPDRGNIYDHFSIDYEFADGSLVLTQHRHMRNCWNFFGEKIRGTEGEAELAAKSRGWIKPFEQEDYAWRGRETENSYQIEHDRLFRAIREGTEHEEAERGAYSSLMAIMGRMAAYTGEEVSWEDALHSEDRIGIDPVSWHDEPPVNPGPDGLYPIPMPGKAT